MPKRAHTALTLATLAFALPAHAGVLTILPDLPSGAPASIVALSADGSTVVTSSAGVGYRWRAGAWQSLGSASGAPALEVRGVSGDGAVVVGRANRRAQRWTSATGWTQLQSAGDPTWPAGGPFDSAESANADGSIVFGTTGSSRMFAEFHTAAAWGNASTAWTDMGQPGANTTGVAISTDGQTIIGDDLSIPGSTQAWFRRSGSGEGFVPVPAGVPFGSSTVARAVSGDGQRIIAQASGGLAFLHVLGAPGSVALTGLSGSRFDVSNSGLVVSDSGLVWSAGNVVSLATFLGSAGLDFSSWSSLAALGISDDGLTIAGTGRRTLPGGGQRDEAFVVVIPAPGPAALLALLALGATRRRR